MTEAVTADSVRGDGDGFASLQRRVTVGAIALCVVYSAIVMMWASPVSFYTLDDPYIHMALAENIARGVFGVNLNEASNPSSSILWPWILAAFEKTGLMLWAPLLVNIACFVVSVRFVLAFAMPRLGPSGANALNVLIVLGLTLLAFNLFGVIFTGMEHSLHALLCIVVVTRVIDAKYDGVTLAALVIGPLVRFEGAIVLAFGVGAAFVDRKWVFAVAAVGLTVLLVGLYALWLHSLGLPVLPSSVLSKSAASSGLVDGGGGVGASLLRTFVKNATSTASWMCAVLGAGLVFAAVKRTGRDRVLALGLIAVLLLAMLLGGMDSYARYTVYLFCVLGLGLVHLLQAELRMVVASWTRAFILGSGVAFLGAQLGVYAFMTTPQAARNIYGQQYQMHRLVQCWGRPVAINDLGWVSLRNDQYVLDLYGLGSETARKARAAAAPGWMDGLVKQADAGVALIYPDWFPDVPASWTLIAKLRLEDWIITPGFDEVSIYATRADAVAPMAACLQALDLPPFAAIELVR
jgi:hypothetical protein